MEYTRKCLGYAITTPSNVSANGITLPCSTYAAGANINSANAPFLLNAVGVAIRAQIVLVNRTGEKKIRTARFEHGLEFYQFDPDAIRVPERGFPLAVQAHKRPVVSRTEALFSK